MTGRKPNQLIRENSPYLLQHAYNPVDWYPWGNEAFQKAKKENKPVLVSIGYSTCHWCHVMAEESFADEEVAQMLNERFVAIKVDREERPDVDTIYMTACQALTGQGGWPLNVFVTPEQKPFYAGTYFPKESRFGYPGFKDVIVQLYNEYKNNPDKITNIGDKLTEAIAAQVPEEGTIDDAIFEKTLKQLVSTFDDAYGGFSNEPKFPSPHIYTYLLRYHRHSGNEKALEMVTKTLDAMADGGIYDHIGFGFARYSVDRMWLVPHFEKMLYDNAMLAIAYTEAYQVTNNEHYKQVVKEICTYVDRNMLAASGGFYSAEDADSEGEEGKFYLWSKREVLNTLGSQLGELYCEAYDITEEGNFAGKNIPNLINTNFADLAKRENVSVATLKDQLEQARKKLFLEREKRIHPGRDDKILSAWNALMIAAFAKASRVFQNPAWLKIAKNASHFIENKLFVRGRLMARYRNGEVNFKGYLDDYAFLLWAYIELYEAALDIRFLTKAKTLADQMIDLFWDQQLGGFYFYGHDAESLIVRPKEVYDGALPSGNSVAALQLLKLAKLTGNTHYEQYVSQMHQAFGKDIKRLPSGFLYFLQSVLFARTTTKEIVLLGLETGKHKHHHGVEKLQHHFLPEVTFLISQDPEKIANIASYTQDFRMIDQQPTIYVCEHFTCKQPTTEIDKAVDELIGKQTK